ncbi:MAG TPA: DUF6159 family protein [Xanthomonadaceae bacterium]|jgi:hypothetical protein|nr:DUF6159 family protein [Xanthomonadaceae bacterium]
MAEKFARSWELVKASAAVLRSDRELLVFPLASAIAVLLVMATFIAPVVSTGMYQHMGSGDPMRPILYLWSFLFYFVQYIVIFFFNTALVGAAMIRLDGGDPTVADGLAIARSKLMPIVGYAAIAATVGMVLRALEERAGFIGKIVVGMIGVAWTLATSMVVPVLVSKDVGPVEAIKESAELLKSTWGENLIGNGGVGVVFGLATFAVMLVGMALAGFFASNGMVPPAILIGCVTVVAVLGLALVQSALAGIYSAALYRYATDGQAPLGFDADALQQAFRIKA